MLGVSAHPFGQWLKHPTEGVPRKADCSPNMEAPTPRLPDGKRTCPASRHATNPKPLRAWTRAFVECGVEIGGSPGRHLGRNLEGGRLSTARGGACEGRAAPTTAATIRTYAACRQSPAVVDAAALTRAIHTPKLLALHTR